MLKGYVERKSVIHIALVKTNMPMQQAKVKNPVVQDVVKADAGHVAVEKYIEETFGSWAVFRPQYMIGSGNNKDCEEWFFDSK